MPSDALSDAVNTPSAAHPAVIDGHVQLLNPGLWRLVGWLQARAMFVIAVSAVFSISLLGIPKHLSQDGWLALVAGRAVAAHGVPQHDFFSYLTHGIRWVDQQWLAQWIMYQV